MYSRIVKLDETLKRKSVFLFGARQTGKSTYLRATYPDAYFIDLLNRSTFQEYQRNTGLFLESLRFELKRKHNLLVIVDEIQKLPALLDEVHLLLEENKDLRFILTGSSARKLKAKGVNLLGGRASWFVMHPIVAKEIGYETYCKDLLRLIQYGKLPSILESTAPWEDLKDYLGLYLSEEIKNEALVKDLEGFSRFLDSVVLTNAEQVNFTDLGSDAQVAPRKVKEYYQLLEDTLIGYLLPAFTATKSRKAMTTPKFFLFDTGVSNVLLNQQQISMKTDAIGKLLEQLIFCELKAYVDYNRMDNCLFYWRSTSKMEVDFLLKTKENKWIGIEVKSSSRPTSKAYRGLKALEEELPLQRKIVVCMTENPRLSPGGIEILPVWLFLQNLWEDDLFSVAQIKA